MIIAIEGISEVGKSTISRMLFEKYREEDKDTILAVEPGHTEAGAKIRNISCHITMRHSAIW